MNTKLFSLLAGVAMLALAGAANAQEPAQAQGPVQLTSNQMDHVTAGATSVGIGAGGAFGTLFSGTAITIATAVVGKNAAAAGDVVSVASSFSPGPGAVAGSALQIVLTSP